MIKDVQYDAAKNDLVIVSSEVPRAANLLDVQLGTLYFAPTWGVDKDCFLNPDYEIQSESFEAYLLQQIGYWGMNVVHFVSEQGKFLRRMVFGFGTPKDNSSMTR